jgi:hypothetical protein
VIFFPPRLLLRLFVILDVGIVGTQMLQLSFLTEGAAKVEASRPGTGAACGTQLPSPSFRLIALTGSNRMPEVAIVFQRLENCLYGTGLSSLAR